MPLNSINNDSTSNYKLRPGDTVQIKVGAIDITTNKVILSNDLYAENSSSWGKVENIIEGYKPKSTLGLASSVTAVQIGNGSGTVMRTVQLQDIASNKIYSSNTQLALTALSPLASAINSKNINTISNILNSSSYMANLIGGSKTANELISIWNKVLSYDQQLANDYNSLEKTYNLIKSIFGIGNKENENKNLLGTLGAIKEIQNYTSTTQLFPKAQQSSSTGNEFLDKLMGIVSGVNALKDSIQTMTGTYKGTETSGVKSIQSGFPVFPINSSGYSIGKMEPFSGIQQQPYQLTIYGKLYSANQGTFYDVYNNKTDLQEQTITPPSITEGKTAGAYNPATKQTKNNYPKRLITTTNESGDSITGYRYPTEAEVANIGIMNPNGLRIATNIYKQKDPTVPELIPDILTNNYPTNVLYGGIESKNINLVQNAYGYPKKIGQSTVANLLESALGQKSSKYKTVEYDYKIDIDDSSYEVPSGLSLEEQLTKARTALGLQVHGNRLLGKAIKYFLYNRYQNIDGGNLAFNRLTTHVFFTRPDLNLLYNGSQNHNGVILDEIKRFSDAFLIWQRNPNIFRLLTDCKRTGEPSPNNFNFLLSNQVTNIEFKDETIETVQSTANWKDYKIEYGGSYKNRGNGEISCTFLETDDLAVLDLMKLWTMYIDNVTIGTWKPSYNLDRAWPSDPKVSTSSPFKSHIYTRTLDYAASCYAFKLAPDGEEILYWTKYYGLIPKSFTLSQLNYTKGEIPNSPLQITVSFAYSFKKDLSPISLLEFNKISNIPDDMNAKSVYEPNYDTMHDIKNPDGTINFASGVRSGVPLVGAPFIAINSVRDSIVDNGNYYGLTPTKDFKLVLKFKPVPNPDNDQSITDSTFMYKNIYSNKIFSSNSRSNQNQNSILNRMVNNKAIKENPYLPEVKDEDYISGPDDLSHQDALG